MKPPARKSVLVIVRRGIILEVARWTAGIPAGPDANK